MPIIYRHWFPCTVTAEKPHGEGYTGYTYKTLDQRDRERFKPSNSKDSVGLKRAIAEYGKEKMQTDIIESEILPIHELVITREKYWIAYFDDYHNGYNRTKGGDGIDPEASREIQRNLIENGTHNFFDSESRRKSAEKNSKIQRKYVEGGTHPFLRKNHPKARLEYYQVYWEFILLYPLGIKEVRKHLCEKFGDIPYPTLMHWTRQWQAESE